MITYTEDMKILDIGMKFGRANEKAPPYAIVASISSNGRTGDFGTELAAKIHAEAWIADIKKSREEKTLRYWHDHWTVTLERTPKVNYWCVYPIFQPERNELGEMAP